jgi:hypothetical protein
MMELSENTYILQMAYSCSCGCYRGRFRISDGGLRAKTVALKQGSKPETILSHKTWQDYALGIPGSRKSRGDPRPLGRGPISGSRD